MIKVEVFIPANLEPPPSPSKMRSLLCTMLCALALPTLPAFAQPSVKFAQPAAILPSGMTRVTLHGDKLVPPLRFWTSAPVQINVVELTPQKAVLDVTPPSASTQGSVSQGLPLGTIGLCVATAEGASAPISLLVDSLPSIAEATDNHSPVSAQTIGSGLAIDGTGDGKLYDYFRFHALAEQSIAIEVLAQPLGSSFDAVVRLLNEQGEPLLTVDDDAISPDCRMRYKFSKTGNYLIEVHDNKFASGGQYRLRLGSFPIVSFAYPAYVTRGSQLELTFGGPDRGLTLPQAFHAPADAWTETLNVTAQGKDNATAACVVRLTNNKQHIETEPNNSLDQANELGDARGINGWLAEPGDRDVFKLNGIKDQTWRFAAKARSFGSPTMLKMQLKNAAGEVLAKTAVADTDEWQFDYKFPADGQYVLECEDLLRRGGPEFAYHVDIGIAAPFALALKPDAKTRDRLLLQPTGGAANLDLLVTRVWNNGPIELRFEPAVPGLTLLNPVIPAGAKEHQLFMQTTAEWQPQNLSGVRLLGKALEAPEATVAAGSAALAVVRVPHVPYPNPWQDGPIWLVGVNDEPAFFEVAAANSDPIPLPRPFADGSLALSIKRIKPEFKEGVTLVKSELPPEWSATPKLDKDTLTIALKHPVVPTAEPVPLKFWWYGNFNGRGLLVMTEVKVRLFEPLQLTATPVPPLKRGEMQKLVVELKREGDQPQPVVLKLANLPAGVTAPENITIPAAESKVEIPLTAAADAPATKAASVAVNASSKLADKEVTATTAIALDVIE